MNINFEIVDNKVNVLTDDKDMVTREVTNNIEEVLICENNIEEMENNLQHKFNKITFTKNKMLSCYGTFAAAALWLACGIFSSSIGIWGIAIIQYLGSIGYVIYAINDVKKNLKSINATKCVIKELEESLKIEKEKLNELNKDKSNDSIDIISSKKTINRSTQIKDLKRKLEVLYNYQINKTKFIIEYKKGILREKALNIYSFDINEYYILEELIKNELDKKNTNKVNKQKTLKRN